jgi:iron complex transport system ATP-binding protein
VSGSRDRAPVVRLRSVRVVRDGTAVLEGVDWDLGEGERWAVLGPNGSGKTTLLQVAGMRLLPTAGTVDVLGERYGRSDVRTLRRRIAFVSGALLRDFRPTITAHDIVVTGRYAALEPWWQRYDAGDHERAEQLLAEAGMAEVSGRTFAVLSEGERQQVLLARALMGRPDLLLLDEPAAGLDLGNRERLLGRLASLAADPAAPAMALVTHHLEEIPPGVTHAMLLRGGRVVAAGPADAVVSSETVSSCFGLPVTVGRGGGRWWAQARP